jgi:hypothetical protein
MEMAVKEYELEIGWGESEETGEAIVSKEGEEASGKHSFVVVLLSCYC